MNIVKASDSHPFSAPVLRDAGGPSNSVESPHGLLTILRRRLRLILAIIAVIMGATALALYLATPLYTSSAIMQLDEAFAINRGVSSEQPSPIREIEQQTDYSIRVQMDALKSRSVAARVVANLKLYENPEFNPRLSDDEGAAVAQAEDVVEPVQAAVLPDEDSADANAEADAVAPQGDAVATAPDSLANVPARDVAATIDKLLSRLEVEQVGTTNYMVITASSQDPELAMRLANAVVESYTETRRVELAEKNSRLLTDLEQRTEELSDRLEEAEYSVADFRRRNNIDASFAVNAGAAEIEGAAASASVARAESAEASARANRQRSAGSADSGLLTNLRNRESALSSELANLTTQYGSRHPDVMSRTAELQEVRRSIAMEASRAAANVEAERDAASAKSGQISADLGRLRSQARTQDIAGPQLAALEREVETSNNLYLGMLERVTELRIQQANPRPEAVPVSPAILPGTPSFPKTGQTLGIAFIASLILGVLMAMVAEAFDNRLRSSEQVRKVTGLPTLAMIPQRGSVPDQIDHENGGRLTPMSVFAEAMRDGFLETTLRTAGKNSRVITVASALPGEGKSTVTLGLGATAIEQGMRAIVVDFDFRKRGLTRMLGLTEHPQGLDTYLAGEVSLEEAISYSDKMPTLASLTITRLPENPASLFAADKLSEMFAALREQFDFVVVDTPPLMALRDAKVLAAYSDATVGTARWGKSTAQTLRPVMQALSGSLIGMIITRVDYRKHARLAYSDTLEYYSKYSYYYSESETERPGFFQRLLNGFRSPAQVPAE